MCNQNCKCQNKLDEILDECNIDQIITFLEENAQFGDDWGNEIKALIKLKEFRQ